MSPSTSLARSNALIDWLIVSLIIDTSAKPVGSKLFLGDEDAHSDKTAPAGDAEMSAQRHSAVSYVDIVSTRGSFIALTERIRGETAARPTRRGEKIMSNRTQKQLYGERLHAAGGRSLSGRRRPNSLSTGGGHSARRRAAIVSRRSVGEYDVATPW